MPDESQPRLFLLSTHGPSLFNMHARRSPLSKNLDGQKVIVQPSIECGQIGPPTNLFLMKRSSLPQDFVHRTGKSKSFQVGIELRGFFRLVIRPLVSFTFWIWGTSIPELYGLWA